MMPLKSSVAVLIRVLFFYPITTPIWHMGNHLDEQMMRVSRLHAAGDMRFDMAPRPEPGREEVLLKVAAVGVCGSDVHYYRDGGIGENKVTDPIVMGHEFSAWVAGTGEGVIGLTEELLVSVDPAIHCGNCEWCRKGHPNLCPEVRFCGTPPIDGVFREYTVMPAENCYTLPEDLDAVDGAMLEPLGVALHAVDLAHLKVGQTVAVLGAGPIGLLTAAVARANGAGTVFMTEPLDYRRAFAKDYGADVILDPGASDVVSEIMDYTDGRGVDVSFEAAGVPETPQQAAGMVIPGGKVIVIGIPSDNTMTFRADTVRRKGLTIKLVRRMKYTYPRAIEMVASRNVDVRSLATHVLPFSKLNDAFGMVAGYEDRVIRAVIQMGQ